MFTTSPKCWETALHEFLKHLDWISGSKIIKRFSTIVIFSKLFTSLYAFVSFALPQTENRSITLLTEACFILIAQTFVCVFKACKQELFQNKYMSPSFSNSHWR